MTRRVASSLRNRKAIKYEALMLKIPSENNFDELLKTGGEEQPEA